MVLAAGVDAHLLRLLLPGVPRLIQAGEDVLHPQPAAGDFQVCQPVPLAVPANLVDPGAKCLRVYGPGAVTLQALEELLHALQTQSGAEPAGENGAPRRQGRQGVAGQRAAFQILRQGPLAGGGRVLPQRLLGAAEVQAVFAQLALQRRQQGGPVRPRQIHLVDKQEGWHTVALQKPPQGTGMGLDAVGPADDQDGAVQHPEGALHLGGEVHMARGVQQRGLQLPQREHGLFGKDGDAPLPLQLLSVQERVPVVHPAQGAEAAGFVQDCLRQRRLPRVHMGQQARTNPFDRLVFRPIPHSRSSLPGYYTNKYSEPIITQEIRFVDRHFS